MSDTSVYLYGGFPSTWNTLVYAAPGVGTITVTSIIATNSTDADGTITIQHVPEGRSPDDSYIVANNLTVAAGSSGDLLPEIAGGLILNPGDMVFVSQGSQSVISVEIDGTLNTPAS